MHDELFLRSEDRQTRWASFENPLGEKGRGGMENGGQKGHACDSLEPGQSHILMNVEGSGIINRIWLTLSKVKITQNLRSVKIECFWDGNDKPAVSAPLGDFFGAPLGYPVSFESMFLSNPEGRSFNSYFKMPFLKGAKIVVTNESADKINHLFYDINYTLCPMDSNQILYFHAFWNRENPVSLAKDYTILPKIKGEGKFVGVCLGVRTNPGYDGSWFGEGEVKFYLDGDDQYPTLCGTGTEDYIGTAWGQRVFKHMTQGCLISDDDKRLYTFYRFHAPDPIYFYEDCKAQIQNMGGCDKYTMIKLIDLKMPVKIANLDGDAGIEQLHNKDYSLKLDSANSWYNFFREDDYSSVAYFYYRKPASELPELPPLAKRIEDLE